MGSCWSAPQKRPTQNYRNRRPAYEMQPKYHQKQFPNAKIAPMEYAPQGEINQAGRRYPVNSQSQTNRTRQAARTNPIPNRFDTTSTHSLPIIREPRGRKAVMVKPNEVRNSSHSREAELPRPQPARTQTRQRASAPTQHRSQYIQIADPLPEDVEVKPRLSSYFDSMSAYAPPHSASEIAHERARRLSRPFGDVPAFAPRSRTPSPPQRLRRAKGKGKALRLDTRQHLHQQWVGERRVDGGEWSAGFYVDSGE